MNPPKSAPATQPFLDFVDIPVTLGRNDPCLCNSGIKWKKCCGSPAEQQRRKRLVDTDKENKQASLKKLVEAGRNRTTV